VSGGWTFISPYGCCRNSAGAEGNTIFFIYDTTLQICLDTCLLVADCGGVEYQTWTGTCEIHPVADTFQTGGDSRCRCFRRPGLPAPTRRDRRDVIIDSIHNTSLVSNTSIVASVRTSDAVPTDSKTASSSSSSSPPLSNVAGASVQKQGTEHIESLSGADRSGNTRATADVVDVIASRRSSASLAANVVVNNVSAIATQSTFAVVAIAVVTAAVMFVVLGMALRSRLLHRQQQETTFFTGTGGVLQTDA